MFQELLKLVHSVTQGEFKEATEKVRIYIDCMDFCGNREEHWYHTGEYRT